MKKSITFLGFFIFLFVALYVSKSSKPAVLSQTATSPEPSATSSALISNQNSKCVQNHGLPNPNCTPGAAAITDASIICAAGYTTKSVRPPVSYTNDLKKQQILEYGYSDTNLADYEEDHLISLELGGSPTDPKNLWPEPRKAIANSGESAEDKDLVENKLHKAVCDGQMSLLDAQKEISTNWESYR